MSLCYFSVILSPFFFFFLLAWGLFSPPQTSDQQKDLEYESIAFNHLIYLAQTFLCLSGLCIFKASHYLDYSTALSDEIALVLSRERKQSSDTYSSFRQAFMLLCLEMDKMPHVMYWSGFLFHGFTMKCGLFVWVFKNSFLLTSQMFPSDYLLLFENLTSFYLVLTHSSLLDVFAKTCTKNP